MNKFIALGLVGLGGVIAFRFLPQELRPRPAVALRRWIAKHMEQLMLSLPANAPPKLVMSILPKLRAQNDEIIALLREQNDKLRDGTVDAIFGGVSGGSCKAEYRVSGITKHHPDASRGNSGLETRRAGLLTAERAGDGWAGDYLSREASARLPSGANFASEGAVDRGNIRDPRFHARRAPLDRPTRGKLVKVLAMLGSTHDAEVLVAARHAERLRLELGRTWNDRRRLDHALQRSPRTLRRHALALPAQS